MSTSFPLRYRDAQGELGAVCHHDGQTLRVCLGGVAFEGGDFDMLDPADPAAPGLERFRLNQGSLADCMLETAWPIALLSPGGERSGTLWARLRLVDDPRRGNLAEESLQLMLWVEGRELVSKGSSGWYEDELVNLQAQFPPGWYLKICFGCAWSDYHPVGHGLWGGLACFRDAQEAYRRVRGKDIMGIWDRRTELVPETHCCSRFERRTPGTGYRG